LSEYRASIEMDMFEEIDGYVVVNGPPANFAEVTDFWDHITPKVIKPLLESIAAAQGVSFDSVTFRPGDFNEPWTESGLRELAIHLAGRLRTAQIEALNDTQFLERTELDASMLALIGTTEWVGPEPKAVQPAGGAPPPPPPSATAQLDAPATAPKRGKPSNAAIAAATPPAAPPSPPKEGAKRGPGGLVKVPLETSVEIWTLFGQGHSFDIGKFCREASISPATYRNYLAGKNSKINNAQGKVIRTDVEQRIAGLTRLLEILSANDL
jgi:hypothetical protein